MEHFSDIYYYRQSKAASSSRQCRDGKFAMASKKQAAFNYIHTTNIELEWFSFWKSRYRDTYFEVKVNYSQQFKDCEGSGLSTEIVFRNFMSQIIGIPPWNLCCYLLIHPSINTNNFRMGQYNSQAWFFKIANTLRHRVTLLCIAYITFSFPYNIVEVGSYTTCCVLSKERSW